MKYMLWVFYPMDPWIFVCQSEQPFNGVNVNDIVDCRDLDNTGGTTSPVVKLRVKDIQHIIFRRVVNAQLLEYDILLLNTEVKTDPFFQHREQDQALEMLLQGLNSLEC